MLHKGYELFLNFLKVISQQASFEVFPEPMEDPKCESTPLAVLAHTVNVYTFHFKTRDQQLQIRFNCFNRVYLFLIKIFKSISEFFVDHFDWRHKSYGTLPPLRGCSGVKGIFATFIHFCIFLNKMTNGNQIRVDRVVTFLLR